MRSRAHPEVAIQSGGERQHMSTYTWTGGIGYFELGPEWTPQHVPGAGDTAVIGSGEVGVICTTIAAMVDIGSTDSAAPAVLSQRRVDHADYHAGDAADELSLDAAAGGIRADQCARQCCDRQHRHRRLRVDRARARSCTGTA